MTTAPGGKRAGALTLLSILVVWFVMLGYRDLFDPDEGRYAEVPREMVASGDWLTPRLQGLKYFEKPPLQYWTTAAALRVFGRSAAVARLSTAVFGIAGVLWVWWVGRHLWGRDAGDFSLLVTASGFLYFVMGHLLTLDMTLTFFLTVGMGSLAVAQRERQRPARVRNWMLLAWAALAAAVLSKGLVGLVLPALALGVYTAWQRDWAMLRHLHLGKGLLLFTALCAPWFVAVSLANDDFARFFFVHEHLERFTTTSHRREGPAYYFVGIFLLGALPWAALAVAALVKPGFAWRPGRSFEPERLFWVYIVVVVLFFSISRSKMPPYILPVWPFVALLAGRHAAGRVRWRADALVAVGVAAALGLATLELERFVAADAPLSMLQSARPWLVSAAAWMAAAGCVQLLWRGSLKTAVSIAAMCAMMSFQSLLWGSQVLAPSRSGHDVARQIRALELPADTPVFLIGTYSPSLAFYLGRTACIVDYTGELEFGIQAEPHRSIRSMEAFERRWRAEDAAVAVISMKHHSHYLDLGLPMHVVDSGPRYTVVVRRIEDAPARRPPDRVNAS